MHIIRIKHLALETTLGIYDWEKEKPRPVILNIEIEADTDKASASDAINDAVDYDTIEKAVVKLVEQGSYNLIEKLAAEVASLVLSLDNRIQSATVEVDKPGALKHAKSVSVTAGAKR